MNSLILGAWVFTSLIYRGQEIPRPNPQLIMTFNFQDNGENILHYYRQGESGSCTRVAQFQFQKGKLHQEVIRASENNAVFCSSDPDMQVGNVSITPVAIRDDRMVMTLGLGEETLTYIWKPCQQTDLVNDCEAVANEKVNP